jgi:iron-sulfur cluster assembly accessory protein
MFNIDVTDNAAKRIAELASEEKEKKILRISVNGGGCSGFKYDYLFVEKHDDGDFKIEKSGAIIVIDEVSQGFLSGAVFDYIEELGASYFRITNPNATAKCGCGNSFGV